MFSHLLRKIRDWKKNRQNRPTLITIEISRAALRQNLKQLQKLAPTWQIAPVLKSNAYGHGISTIAEILEREDDLPFFCVDSYFEAETLRHYGVNKPLLILGYTPPEILEKNKLKNVHFTVGSLEQLRLLIEKKSKQTVQIKFDTGMHRQGIDHTSVDEVNKLLGTNRTLKITGVLSHLADAETPNSSQTEKQISNWNILVEKMRNFFPEISYYHLTNSAGLQYHQTIKANVGRAGLALYGFNPGNLSIDLQPALTMKSLVSEIREISPGEQIGYNGFYIAQQKTVAATIPCGYFEGVDRRLSNQGMFLINDKPAKILGRVSMNISSCDVTGIPEARTEEPVIIISKKTTDPNSIANIANLCRTIPYEILVHLPAHLRRVVVD